MIYKLKFLPSAQKEWDKLDNSIKGQFKKKLAKCLENPHIPANRLHDFDCAYKIKLRSSGYRLVYEVDDGEIIVFVIAVGKRENNTVYEVATQRKS
ncbi:MAG: type II toxin-antitoxin system RelE/ParE family toxin [Methylococcales bacterium]|nr:type II toxin-antitoxin system RelE/ParE family toxin [Methylococcales bacterium]MDD5755423.1 type II toxin-antitoxin system RelE/ParE family toxin [Methylococcales bacterium]